MSSTSPTAVVHSQNVGHDTITPASQSSETGQFLSRMSGGDEKIVTEGDATIKKNDWPLQGIKDPHENDVLFGRGGGTNHHPGNKRYRKMVEDRKVEYVDAKRLDKPLVALDIIKIWRNQDPPGRFLKYDEKTQLWSDVGDKKAREKTSQALREKAPLIRKQIDEGKRKDDDDDDEDGDFNDYDKTKNTRFAEGTNMETIGKNGSKKPALQRDHSLGREILDEGEAVTVEGFSWQEPFTNGRQASQGSLASDRVSSHGPPPPMPYPPPDGTFYPRFSSGPPPPGPYGPPPAGDRFPSGRFESWGSVHSMHPPPAMPAYPYPPSHQGSWTQRDHSLCNNPLPYANVAQAAPAPYFDGPHRSWGHPHGPWGPPPPDGRNQSWGSHLSDAWSYHSYDGRTGSWGPPPFGHPHSYPHPGARPPPYPPASSGQQSTSKLSPKGAQNSSSRSPVSSAPPSPPKAPSSPLYSVDPKVASKWSGKDEVEIKKSMSGDSNTSDESDRFDAPVRRPIGQIIINTARPDLIKRATSNQNETMETRPDLKGPSIKRAALNRDSSAAANRLKEQYVPGYQKRVFDAEKEVSAITHNLEQSWPVPRPEGIVHSERTSTYDHIAMDLQSVVKPAAFSSTARSSTVEALDLFLEEKKISKPEKISRNRTMEEVLNDLREDAINVGIPRPTQMTNGSRLSTTDYLDIITEPIDDDGLSTAELLLDRPASLSRDSSLSEAWVAGA